MRDNSEQLGNFNSRAKFKQRIAGGAVLLIVLAIFLPFIFNHSHTPSATESNASVDVAPVASSVANGAGAIEINAPASEAPAANVAVSAENQNMDSNQPGLTAPQSEAVPVAAAPPAPAPAGDTSEQSMAMTQPASTANPSGQVTVAPSESVSAVNSSDQVSAAPSGTVSAPSSSEPTQPIQAVQMAAPASAPAKSARVDLPQPTKTMAKSSTASQGKWLIQAGSFTQMENAKDLAASLRDNGFNAYVKRGPNRVVRVYVGSITSEKQANKIQRQLKSEFNIDGLIKEKRN